MKAAKNMILFVYISPTLAFAQSNDGCAGNSLFNNPFDNMMYGYGGGFGGGLFSLIFWILLIWLAFMLFQYYNKDDKSQRGGDPMNILKERYAKGEIDKKQFEEMKKDLEK
ncbi:MAG: SHOCT domain-containing protein [Candidatus Gracilibacteria bacterium]|nr:SHOCT domain-containing protein [Candidatus Gracilibacteria bacterium]